MIDRVADILGRCATRDLTTMPPTELYNEGWLLRLALDWSSNHPGTLDALDVPKGTCWYSEAFLPSPFLPRTRGDRLAESYTHADGAVGHFTIGGSGAGDLVLDPQATHFVVLEAKLGSRLSSGTSNAPGYDQAARNVACMAQVLALASRRPADVATLGFYVLAPSQQIDRGLFSDQLTTASIAARVAERVTAYDGDDRVRREVWQREWLEPILCEIGLGAVAWETVVEAISEADAAGGAALREFYASCLRFNRLNGDTL